MRALARIAQALGYDLVPRRKGKDLRTQLVLALARHDIGCVLDAGANVGQYASGLREAGYAGHIVSFEPVSRVHAALTRRAAADPLWTVAPRMALGAEDGEVAIDVSAESDMSSLRPQTAQLRAVSPSSAVTHAETVPLRRLDSVLSTIAPESGRLFLKIDTQGYEPEVVAGASGVWDRIAGVQLEMSLVQLYEGELPFRAMLDLMADKDMALHLVMPGYFEPRLARQVQIDGVFFRD